MALKPKHKKFIEEALKCGNNTEAYMKVYGVNYIVAKANATRLMKKKDVRECYERAKLMSEQKVAEKIADKIAWSKEKAIQEVLETMKEYKEMLADIRRRNEGAENRDFINPMGNAYSKAIYDGVDRLNEMTGINRQEESTDTCGSLAAQILSSKPQTVDDMNIENYTAPNIGGDK